MEEEKKKEVEFLCITRNVELLIRERMLFFTH